MKLFIVVACLSMTACAVTTTETVTTSQEPTAAVTETETQTSVITVTETVEPEPPEVIENENCVELMAARYTTQAQEEFGKSFKAVKAYDAESASYYMRRSATNWEKSTEYIHDDEVSAYLNDAAYELRQAADSLELYDFNDVSRHLENATSDIQSATQGIKQLSPC